MGIAHEIMAVAGNASDAMTRAEKLTDNIDQDWGNEKTTYTFQDDSVLVVSGPQVSAYNEAPKMYMNIETGSVDDYDGWQYQDDNGAWINAVDRGEVVEVVKNNGSWVEV